MLLARRVALVLMPCVLSLASACGDPEADPSAEEENAEETASPLTDAEATPATGTQIIVQVARRQYLTSGYLGRILANGSAADAAVFTAVRRGASAVALRAPSGKYLTAARGGGGAVVANATSIGTNETFRIEYLGDGKSALRCADGKHFVRAEGGGGGEVNAETTVTGPWTPLSFVTRKRAGKNRMIGIAGTGWPSGPAEIGARFVRSDFSWSGHQPTPNGPIVGFKDDFARAAQADGIQVLGVLAYAPEWARLGSCNTDARLVADAKTKCEPRSAAEYGRFAGAMARHYAPLGVHHWEIWNEANSKWFWRPLPNPKLYAQMLAAAHDAIKAADPTATVVAGATASLGEYNPQNQPDLDQIDPRNFLQQVYANGAGDKFDALSHHPYTWSNPDSPIESNPNWAMMFKDQPARDGKPAVPSLVTILRNHGDGGKKIWNTEYGAPTVVVRPGVTITEQKQSAIMLASFGLWEDYPWAGPFFWFNYKDFDTTATTGRKDMHMGIIESTSGVPGCTADGRPTGTAKIAYCTFKNFMK